MERWNVYDKDRVKIGNTMVQGSKFETGAFHLVVHVIMGLSNATRKE